MKTISGYLAKACVSGALSFVLYLAGAVTANAAQTSYPLTIHNCGRAVTFDKAPERTVSIGQSTTEILYALGLSDRVVGTAVWFAPVMKKFRQVNAGVKRLADNDPSFESVVGRKPELVTAQFEWHVGSQGTVGTREQFSGLGINTYIAPADCVGKDNSGSGDGVRNEFFSMALVYREIRELSEIFDVQARGQVLIASLKKRERAAIASVQGDKIANSSVVYWFSSKKVEGDAFAAGSTGVPAYISKQLGIRNIIKTKQEWPLVSWETIASRNPSIIVMAEMSRRRYGADDNAVKRKFLKTDPVTRELAAVRENHLVTMDVEAMHPSIRVVDGMEQLARSIQQFGMVD